MYKTSVRLRRCPQHGYSPSTAYVRLRRRLQYGYGPTVATVYQRCCLLMTVDSLRLPYVCQKPLLAGIVRNWLMSVKGRTNVSNLCVVRKDIQMYIRKER